MRLGPLDRPPQIELVRVKNEAFLGNLIATQPIRSLHVEDDLLVNQQLVMQTEVVAVRIEQLFIERIDDNVTTESLPDLITGKNHVAAGAL